MPGAADGSHTINQPVVYIYANHELTGSGPMLRPRFNRVFGKGEGIGIE
jgi:hypothetical protein